MFETAIQAKLAAPAPAPGKNGPAAAIAPAETVRTGIEQTLSGAHALQATSGGFKTAMAYAADANTPADKPPPSASRNPNDTFSLGDLADIVNPLQHLPLISTLYREMTGDGISPVARVVGGAIYGGPLGAGASMVNVIVEAETGKDIAGNLIGLVDGTPSGTSPAMALDEPPPLSNTTIRFADLSGRAIARDPSRPALSFNGSQSE